MSRPRRPASEPATASGRREGGATSDGRGVPPATRPSLSLSIQRGEGVDELPVTRSRLRRWAAAAIDADATLALRFVGEREARALNAQYRHREYAPNVLTFPYHAAGERISADIVICLPVASREARTQRKVPVDHLAHLVIHGVLHACGHDHERIEDAARMQATETVLLRRFGIDDPWRR